MPTSVPTTGNCAAMPAAAQASPSTVDSRCGPDASSVYTSSVSSFERGETGGGGQRVAGQRSGVEHRAQRRQRLHDLAASTDGADRQPAADDLAERGQVGRHVVHGLRTAVTEAEAGDDLVEHQQRADAVALGAQALQEPLRSARPHPCWRRPVRR